MPDLDLEKIMKMAQNAQAELQKAQDNLDQVEVEGASRRRTGQGPRLRQGPDHRRQHRRKPAAAVDEKAMLEDLIAAALNDARAKADAAAAEEMQKMSAGLPLPPGFKLPF